MYLRSYVKALGWSVAVCLVLSVPVHAADHGGHDPHDLGNANATGMMENPIELRYDTALATLAVFVTLLLLLGKFAWRPILEGLDRREALLANQAEEADKNAREAAESLQAYKDQLAAAESESQTLIAQARRDAEVVAEKIRAEASDAAERERARAVADIEVAKNNALREIADKGADLAVMLAGRIVRRELNAEDHNQLIREAMDSFSSKN